MATEAQVLANQANAQKSTGPVTAEGKATSSHNATKHGLSASDQTISLQHPQRYTELLAAYAAKYTLDHPAVFALLRRLALATLREELATEHELALIHSGRSFDELLPELTKLQRYQTAAANQVNQALRELRRLEQDEARHKQEQARASKATLAEVKDVLQLSEIRPSQDAQSSKPAPATPPVNRKIPPQKLAHLLSEMIRNNT